MSSPPRDHGSHKAEAVTTLDSVGRVNLQQLQHLRTKNALWRSWSVGDGLSDGAAEESDSAGRQMSAKASPKAWEILHEKFLLDVGDSSLVVELTRRHHGGSRAHSGKSSMPIATTTDSGGCTSPYGGDGDGEGAVRRGQLFGYLAARSAKATPLASASSYQSGSPGMMWRADSGASEAQFGMELTGSFEQSDLSFRARHRGGSAGSVDEVTTPRWTQDVLHPRASDSFREEIEQDGGDIAKQFNLLRKKFTQARNFKRRDRPDDSASPFLGDELSVHRNNYFGSIFNNKYSSSNLAGRAAEGSADQAVRLGSEGAATIASSIGSEAGAGVRGADFDEYPFGSLSGVRISHERVPSSGERENALMVSRNNSDLPPRVLGGGLAGGENTGGAERSKSFLSVQARDADVTNPGLAFSVHSVPDITLTAWTETAAAAGKAGESEEVELLRQRHETAHSAISALTHQMRQQQKQQQQQQQEQPCPSSPPMETEPPPIRNMVSNQRLGAESIVGKEDAAGAGLIAGGGGSKPNVASTGFGEDELCNVTRKTESSPDAEAKVLLNQDHGQAVMLPLLDWNDWTPDKRHWTYPAVVRAFPRGLFEGDPMLRRSRFSRTENSTANERRAPESPGMPGGESATQREDRFAGIVSRTDVRQQKPKTVQPPTQGTLSLALGARGSAEEGQTIRDILTPKQKQQQRPHRRPLHGQSQSATAMSANRPEQQKIQNTPLMLDSDQSRTLFGSTINLIDGTTTSAGIGSDPDPDPFDPYSMGEVWVRRAEDSDLAPAGVGAGPWRSRWLMLRQTYLFEFLRPPPMATELPSMSSGAAAVGHGQEAGSRSELQEEKEEGEGGSFPEPAGFLCLSKATVEEGGLFWGPRTLLLRCHIIPIGMADKVNGNGNLDVGRRAGVGEYLGKEIRVELRVPSTEIGTYWMRLLRGRVELEMSSLFEPVPIVDDYAGDDQLEEMDAEESAFMMDDHNSDSCTGGGNFRGFSVLGTGRFSKVVWAKRKRSWRSPNDGGDICAVKIIDKDAFWSHVRIGKERADTLAREVFCQSILTCDDCLITSKEPKSRVSQPSEQEPSREQGENRQQSVGQQQRRGGQQKQQQERCQGFGGYRDLLRTRRRGVVRLHSVLETANELVLELELMSRDNLFDHINGNGVLAEPEAAGMVQNLLLAIDRCNKHGFCHRDIKPSNLLYAGPTATHGVEGVLLADFGMATRAGRDGLVRGRCGTSGYVAPEILKAKVKEGYGLNVDIFSAGVVLYICLCGYEPFYGVNEEQLIAANKSAEFEFDLPEWGDVSEGAKDLISKMLEADPTRRLTPTEALQHPWILQHRGRK